MILSSIDPTWCVRSFVPGIGWFRNPEAPFFYTKIVVADLPFVSISVNCGSFLSCPL